MIWIRADANREIGMGHFMRCLSVAEALIALKEEVCFIIADESVVTVLQAKHLAYRILHTGYMEMDEELKVLIPLLQQEKPACVLIDSYYVTASYLIEVRKYTKTAYMDDMFAFPYPVDILINYNIYGEQVPYHKEKSLAHTKLLIGPSFVPLRREFYDAAYKVNSDITNVMITTGGSDKYNLATQILLDALAQKRLSEVCYHVVSGAFNSHYAQLLEIQKQYANVHIHSNVTNMAQLMQSCDVAISAGGSTMYELSAIGVPILCFSFVDNQEKIVTTFLKKGFTAYGGDYLKEKSDLPHHVTEHLLMLKDNCKIRELYSKKERDLVDGLGADRIARALVNVGGK